MVNVSAIANQTIETAADVMHEATAIPSLLIGYIGFSLIVLVTGLLMIDGRRSGYGKFMLIWIISSILAGLVVLWIAMSPETINLIATTVTSWFS